MIVIKLQGGLGNQLFQYALAVGIRAKTGQEFLFDPYGLGKAKGVTPWPYMLDCMAFTVHLATPEQSQKFQQEKTSPVFSYVRKMIGIQTPSYIKEKFGPANVSLLAIHNDAYLDGFWQSEKYFDHCKDDIRKLFRLKYQLSQRACDIADEMSGDGSVSLHIRRGDYVQFKKVGDTLGVCGLEYFNRALQYIEKKVPSPHIFIFSDDIEWAKTNLTLPHKITYVSGGATTYYEEMMLMSHCRHHILSNSSFSWWGAWLDARSDKIVVAPQPWFKDPMLENKDITPPSWIRI